jgi:hypothetical protein
MFVARLFELLKYRFDAENMARGLHALLEYHKNNPNSDPAGKFLNGSYKQIAGWPDSVSDADGGSGRSAPPTAPPAASYGGSERLGPSQRSNYGSNTSRSRSRSPKRNRERSPDRRGARRDRDDERDDYSSSKRRRHDDSYGDSRDYIASSGSKDRESRERDDRPRDRERDRGDRDRDRDRGRDYSRDRERDSYRDRERPSREEPRPSREDWGQSNAVSNSYPISSSSEYAVPTTNQIPLGGAPQEALAPYYYGGGMGDQQQPLDNQGDSYQQNESGRFGRDALGDRNFDNGRGGRGRGARGGRGGRGGRGAGRGSYNDNHGGDDGNQNRKERERDPSGTTLDLGSVPEELNNVDAIWKHFSKFGQIKNIITEPHSSRAHVKFGAPEEASAAIRSPDAVMGNRFVRIYWGSQDIGPAQPGSDVMNKYAIKILGKEATQFVSPEIKEKEREIAQQKEELRAKLQARLKDQKELLQRLEKVAKNEELAQETRDSARKDLKTVLDAMNATIQTMKGLTSPAPPVAPAGPSYGAGRGRGRGRGAPFEYGDASHLEQRLAELHKERVTRGIPMPRGRGARGGRGGGPGRFNLDLRPTTFKITSVPSDWHDEGRLRTFFESYGGVRYINVADDQVVVQMDNRKNAETALAASSALGGGSMNWTDNPDPSLVEQLEMEQHQQDLLAIDAAHSAAQSSQGGDSDGIEVATSSSKDEIEVEPYYEEETGDAM